MRTIYGVLFIALLAAIAFAANTGAGGAPAVKKPDDKEYCSANGALLPSATACSDEDPDECVKDFTAPSDVGVNPVARDPKCVGLLKTFAISNCAKRCALCCLTPQYDCQDAKGYETMCAASKDSCKITTPQEVRDGIIKLCPQTCGLCNAAGACRDNMDSCAATAMLCHDETFGPTWREQCAMTCGTCDQNKTPTPPPVAPPQPSTTPRAVTGECGETRECATYMRQGFCTNTWYSIEFRRKTCGKSCGLC